MGVSRLKNSVPWLRYSPALDFGGREPVTLEEDFLKVSRLWIKQDLQLFECMKSLFFFFLLKEWVGWEMESGDFRKILQPQNYFLKKEVLFWNHFKLTEKLQDEYTGLLYIQPDSSSFSILPHLPYRPYCNFLSLSLYICSRHICFFLNHLKVRLHTILH